MSRCHTDCLEKPICRGFKAFGGVVGRKPWWFLVIPLLLSAGLGGGFYRLKETEANDIEDQFTPMNGPAKVERELVKSNFPQDDADFSSQRLVTEGTYASLILVSESNILTNKTFMQVQSLDKKVKNIIAVKDNVQIKYENICATVNKKCVSNAILDIVEINSGSVDQTPIHFPMHSFENTRIFVGTTLGGVNTTSQGVVTSAKAIRLLYYLRENSTSSTLWLQEFLEVFKNESTEMPYIKILALLLMRADTAQLSIFTWEINSDLNVTEELLDAAAMHATTTANDIFQQVERCVNRIKLEMEEKPGVLAKILKNLREENDQCPRTISHCIVHQEALCGKVLNMDHVMHTATKTVHLIMARGLNHCRFQAFLEELNVECGDLQMYDSVKAFQLKLRLWEKQMQQGKLFHFPTCQAISNSLTNVTIPSAGFTAKLNLHKEFEHRFLDFNKQFFSNPFGVDVNNAPEHIQMGLIELQCNDTLKAKFNSIGAAEFYHLVTLPQIYLHTAQVLSLFGCIYLCKQLFH
ncbi:PTHD3 protein, partial [Amia calva]|nr:PTHD3 protein [Amia calva]